MDKNSEIKFVGQPNFKQIITLVQKVDIQLLIRAHDSDLYYKAFNHFF
jgi:adenylate cyclase class IV